VRAGAAFVAGLVVGAAGAGVVATRVRRPAPPPVAALPTPAIPVSASPSPATPPAPLDRPPSPEGVLGEPSPAAPPLGVLDPRPATPAVTPNPWAPTPEPEAPLGARAPSPVPGDSTDALLTPRSLAAPALLPHVPSVIDLDRLRARDLILPVQGYDLRRLRDNFAEKRGTRVHEAIDMAAPRGTPVLAVDDGVVRKLFTSAAGGFTVYQFDDTGTYSYYYAHLDRYAEELREGQTVKKGERLGYVGTSGNAPPGTPHLHFTIFKLAPTKRWWEGAPINPFPLWALRR
jgi:murein DD-endopeptidase MepM/ murein hydrolase activator NlpD